MLVYAVRSKQRKEKTTIYFMVGIFYVNSYSELLELIDEEVSPTLCEYREITKPFGIFYDNEIKDIDIKNSRRKDNDVEVFPADINNAHFSEDVEVEYFSKMDLEEDDWYPLCSEIST